jgi:GTP-binding protein Era
MDTFPREGDTLQRVLELVRRQWEGVQSEEWIHIALVGPARTGKSTILETIRGGRGESTRPIFSVVDTQRLDEFLGYRKGAGVPRELEQADIILLVLDARYAFNTDTVQMVRSLEAIDKPFLVALNKMDAVRNPRRVTAAAKKELGVPVIPVSAFERNKVNRLLKAVVAAHSKALYPLAHNLPQLRKSLCNGIVTQAAFGAGLVGAVPIPISDLLPLAGIQTGMILKIARVYGFRIDRARARELLPVFAAGMLVREGAHALRSRLPVQKKLIAVSIAGTWTFLIGRLIVSYFEQVTKALEGRTEPIAAGSIR